MSKKLFSAERRIRSVLPSNGTPASLADVLAEVLAMREDLRAMGRGTPHVVPAPTLPRPLPEAIDRSPAEIAKLKAELRDLANNIQQTKLEIAALRPASSKMDRLLVVSNELDAVVAATESATQNILDAAEAVDSLASTITAMASDMHARQVAEEIKEKAIAIFEACNFQDITGQRITKVVTTLKYVEERVEAMIEIWGRDSFEGLPLPDEIEVNTDKKLLNGPQLGAVSQEDIDKLFG